MRAKIALWGAVAVLGFGAVACGGGGDDDSRADEATEDGDSTDARGSGDTGKGDGGGQGAEGDDGAATGEADGGSSDGGPTGGSDDRGGGNVDAGGEAFVDAIVETSDDSSVTDDQNRCFAEAVIIGIGVDGFKDAGVTPDDIRKNPEATPTDLGITFDEDMKERFWTEVNKCSNVREMFLQSISQGQQLTAAQTTCLSNGLDEAFVKAMMLGAFTGDASAYADPNLMSKLSGILTTCGIGTE